MQIFHHPHPVLRKIAIPYERDEVNKDLQDYALLMLSTMYREKGIGLAANQVGLTRRIIVIDPSLKHDRGMALINPRVVQSSGSATVEEGCLSLPGYEGPKLVTRPEWVRCEFINPAGRDMVVEGEGALARIIQHEIDHLDGIMFTDRAK